MARKKQEKASSEGFPLLVNDSLTVNIQPQWLPTKSLGEVFHSHFWQNTKDGNLLLRVEYVAGMLSKAIRIEKEDGGLFGVVFFDIYGDDPDYEVEAEEVFRTRELAREFALAKLKLLLSNRDSYLNFFA